MKTLVSSELSSQVLPQEAQSVAALPIKSGGLFIHFVLYLSAARRGPGLLFKYYL